LDNALVIRELICFEADINITDSVDSYRKHLDKYFKWRQG